jgi:hypothetical protein
MTALLRWIGSYRASQRKRRLLRRIAALEQERDALTLQLEAAKNKVASLEDENAFLTSVAQRQRMQVEAEMAITARQVATGQAERIAKR